MKDESKAKGGHARAKSLSPAERSQAASNAAKARWSKYVPKPKPVRLSKRVEIEVLTAERDRLKAALDFLGAEITEDNSLQYQPDRVEKWRKSVDKEFSQLQAERDELIQILNESINIEFVDGEVNRGDEGWWLLENNKWTFSGCFPSPLEAIRELRKLRDK